MPIDIVSEKKKICFVLEKKPVRASTGTSRLSSYDEISLFWPYFLIIIFWLVLFLLNPDLKRSGNHLPLHEPIKFPGVKAATSCSGSEAVGASA
jgi:hypothetical protein